MPSHLRTLKRHQHHCYAMSDIRELMKSMGYEPSQNDFEDAYEIRLHSRERTTTFATRSCGGPYRQETPCCSIRFLKEPETLEIIRRA